MNVLHFSLTPLVASPYRINEALNMIDGVTSRSVVFNSEGDLYKKLNFPSDLEWATHKDQVITLAEQADILHFHNFVDLDCKKFSPIDFKTLWNQGKPMVRQFHSIPDLICQYLGITRQQLFDCPIPKLAIAQYPERFYPNAKVIPNIVNNFRRPKPSNEIIRIGYAPSNFRGATEKRWDTKGYLETKFLLNKFVRIAKKKKLAVELDIIEKTPFNKCLKRKAECDILIDDLVTGSYHMSTLEGLASGTVVLTFADQRVISEVNKLTGGQPLPIVNTRLEELHEVLLHLVRNPQLVAHLKQRSYEWMQLHWRPEQCAQHFVELYKEVIINPQAPFPARFNANDPTDLWFAIDQYDINWRSRHKSWPKRYQGIPWKTRLALYRLREKFGFV